MAEVHGSLARIYANGLDISTGFREAESGTDRELVDSTTFAATDTEHVASPVSKGMTSASGLLDANPYTIQTMLAAAANDLGGDSVLVHMMLDASIGDPGFLVYGTAHQHRVKSVLADLAQTNFEAQSNSHCWVKALHPKAARTAAHNTARLDNTVASTDGGISALQVFAMTGTTPVVTIKVQDDDNDDNWVDLVTHTAVNAAGVTAGYRDVQTVAGTVNRGLRVDLAVTSGSLTSITFALQFGRY